MRDRRPRALPWPEPMVMPAALLLGERVIDDMFRSAGGMFEFRFPGLGRAVMVRDPAMVRQILRASPEDIDQAGANRVQEPVIGRLGLGRLDGEEHRRLRGILLPSLRGGELRRLRESTASIAQRTVDACPAGTPFALLPRLRVAMLQSILAITVGTGERVDEWNAPLRLLLRRADSIEITVRYFLRHAGGLALWPSWHRLHAECDRLVYAEIARRRRRGEDRDDLLGVLMRARDDHGAPLTDRALRDQVISVVAGARTTTATGLAWAFERVARHPAALRRLTAEADEGGQDGYAAAVAYEALRVRPPVAFIGRMARRPYELGGHRLRPGTMIVVHLRALHHDPDLFPDPAAFRPERWLGRRPGGYGWMPFGGGSHTCIGDHLAIMQIKTFLHVFARSVAIAPADPGDEPVKWRAVSNAPRDDCRLVLRRRSDSGVQLAEGLPQQREQPVGVADAGLEHG
ncbi:cytochrome P450 [Actinomadura fulvescens]|uniref:Cytochrome P450 n=1 Tax=Actinomadura fulvescens TaxID=46160 RepID=A0ABN3QKS6_9ACTN